jgi:predicted membrane protein
MENQDHNSRNNFNNNWENPRGGVGGKVLAGMLLITVGLVILASKLNFLFLPHWVFSWQMILIVVGLYIGFKHNFRKSVWLILVLIGSFFLVNDLIIGFNMRLYFWPFILIAIGLWVMLKPKKEYPKHFYAPQKDQMAGYADTTDQSTYNDHTAYEANYISDEVIDSVAIFGGVKKNIISKNFKGGEVVSVFGGTELNLSQADMQHPVVLEATQIFGGTTLVIPPHWEVKSEMVAILGGIDDKRPIMPGGYDANKVLIIKGTTLFGGLQLKSY